MAGKQWFISFTLVFAVGMLVILSACFSSKYNWAPGPPEGPSNPFQTIHIEGVDIPSVITANEAATLILHLSSDADPPMLQSSYELRCRTDSSVFAQGVASSQYEAGLFFGLHIVPSYRLGINIDLGLARPVVELPVTFTEPGRHVLYFGHNRHAADGGRGITLPESPYTGEYPAENDFVEYLKVVVEVQL